MVHVWNLATKKSIKTLTTGEALEGLEVLPAAAAAAFGVKLPAAGKGTGKAAVAAPVCFVTVSFLSDAHISLLSDAQGPSIFERFSGAETLSAPVSKAPEHDAGSEA